MSDKYEGLYQKAGQVMKDVSEGRKRQLTEEELYNLLNQADKVAMECQGLIMELRRNRQ